MRARRLIAVGLAAALLSGGAAVAAEGDDNVSALAEQHATHATTDGTTVTPDAEAGLSGTLSGNAAEALKIYNQARAAANLRTLREEPALTTMAQAWADHMAATDTFALDPDLDTAAKPLPGDVTGSMYEFAASGPIGASIADYVKTITNDPKPYAYDAGLNHAGIGWAISGTRGYLYIITVAYRFGDIGPSDTFYSPVEWLATTGITTGFPDGSFQPVGQVTREAMAAFLYRYANNTTQIPACDPAQGRTFYDVTVDHPFCGAIKWLAQQGITTGYPDGSFHPGEPVSREAMAAFLYRTFSKQAIPTCDPAAPRVFTDVKANHPFCGAIEWLATSKITTGWPDGTFRPGLSVERQAMAAFLYRATAS